MKKKTNLNLCLVECSRNLILFLFILIIAISCKENKVVKNTTLVGAIFGTSYSAIYDSDVDYTKQFDSLFYIINKSMSTYQVNSEISKFNRNEDHTIDLHFKKVFRASQEIYKETNGAFDPTIGAVVNAWDFGPDGAIKNLDSLKIDSLMWSVGLDKLTLKKNQLVKQHPQTFLDFNAIAKGYGVDVIADFLESQQVQNYLVEIGGEIRAKGQNIEKKSSWRVGVDQPRFDGEQSVFKAISLKDEAMATSGTYRKFKVDKNGNRYAHIIDAKTGYPSKTSLLSISVLASDCMTADAYATAFKAMGINKIKTFLKGHPELKVLLIFENEQNVFETLNLNGFPNN